jgi:hypothetical protein
MRALTAFHSAILWAYWDRLFDVVILFMGGAVYHKSG